MTNASKETGELSLRNVRRRHILYFEEGKPIFYDKWVMNEPISSYEESFKFILDRKTIPDLIRTHSAPIVIDLLAPPRSVYDLLSGFPNGRGLAVSLPDHSIDEVGKDIQDAYKAKNVKWLTGDITHPGTWVDIEQWLAGDKAHLIMERGWAGIDSITVNKKLVREFIKRVWSFLSPESGVLLLETPHSDELLKRDVDLNAWVKSLQDVVDIEYEPEHTAPIGGTLYRPTIMITRTPNSPSSLPLI